MITFDAIKSAYRQSKEGFVVSFVIHPNDHHEAIANAAIGSQWQITAIPMDNDGNPDMGGEQAVHTPSMEGGVRLQESARPPQPTEQKMAGILCKSPDFWKYAGVENEEKAANFVRYYCNVKSRKELLPGTVAAAKFILLYDTFRKTLE